MRNKPASDWCNPTHTVCLAEWVQRYLDVAKVHFEPKTYKEKGSVFKRFFNVMPPDLPVTKLKSADILDYVISQKEKRSGNAANHM